MRILRRGRLFWERVAPILRRHKKPLLAAIGVLAIFIWTVQFLYPAGEALPRARLNGQAVGGAPYDELVERIKTSFQDAKAEVKAGDKSKAITLSDIGATAEAETMAKDMLHYPWWQRIIPLSLFIKAPEAKELKVTLSNQPLEEAAKGLSEELSIPAENAKLTIAEGKLATTLAKPGQKVAAETVKDTLSNADFRFGTTTINIAAEEQAPAITDDDIAAIRAQAEEILKRQIVIVAEDGREFKAEPTDITSWLTVAVSDQNQPELTTNPEQLAAYINRLNGEVGTPPGTATANMVDGEEISRTSAPSGLAIASDELQEGIKKALFDTTAPQRLAIRMVVVPPNVRYERSYTSSQKGLGAYVDYVASSENIRLAVSQVGGKGWSARGRADEQTVSASTYKLYVAYMLFKQIADGKLQWGSRVLDTDAAGCLERMIVVSDNACAEEFIRMFEGKRINEYLYSNGISRKTSLIAEDGVARTTAADLEKMLRGIEDGSMIGGSDRSRLLGLMERQRYRSGVPAGSSGEVYDKVGFLWDYLNDAAIVRHPKGTYVIAVMSKGASWQKIAEITRQVEQIMYS